MANPNEIALTQVHVHLWLDPILSLDPNPIQYKLAPWGPKPLNLKTPKVDSFHPRTQTDPRILEPSAWLLS